jgi:hypothetical protein
MLQTTAQRLNRSRATAIGSQPCMVTPVLTHKNKCTKIANSTQFNVIQPNSTIGSSVTLAGYFALTTT